MTTAANFRGRQLARQLRLIAVLHSDGWQSLHSISAKTGVTTRTIRRDLELLEEAYFPVVSMKNDDGIRRWKLRRSAGCPLCGRAVSPTPNGTPAHDAVRLSHEEPVVSPREKASS